MIEPFVIEPFVIEPFVIEPFVIGLFVIGLFVIGHNLNRLLGATMGRNAKLKQQRKQQRKQQAQGDVNRPVSPAPTDNPQEFVRRLAQEGYTLEQSMRAPTLPDQDPRPEL